MSQKSASAIAVIGIDIGKNSFHIVGHDERGAIVLRQKWSRGQVEARFANMPPCLVGTRAECVGRDRHAELCGRNIKRRHDDGAEWRHDHEIDDDRELDKRQQCNED
jgi:transposase